MKQIVDLTTKFETIEMRREDFAKYDACPVQRNHQNRAKTKKTREKLSILKPQHCKVSSAILVKPAYDPVSGLTYVKGHTFKVDGHTRIEFWDNYATEVPEKLSVDRYYVETIEELRDLYYSFDNTDNTEKSHDIAFGVCRNMGVSFDNNKLYNVSSLCYAAHYHNKKLFEKVGGYDGHGISAMYSLFIEELKYLDSFKWTKVYEIKGPLRAAALLFMRKYQDDISYEIVKRAFTNRFREMDDDGRMDGVTNLIEWVKVDETGQNYKLIPDLIEKSLYWFNQQYLEDTQGKEYLKKKGNHDGMLELYAS